LVADTLPRRDRGRIGQLASLGVAKAGAGSTASHLLIRLFLA
jgi:hypothetical protein